MSDEPESITLWSANGMTEILDGTLAEARAYIKEKGTRFPIRVEVHWDEKSPIDYFTASGPTALDKVDRGDRARSLEHNLERLRSLGRTETSGSFLAKLFGWIRR